MKRSRLLYACAALVMLVLLPAPARAAEDSLGCTYIYALDTDGIEDGNYLIASGKSDEVSVLTNADGKAAGTAVTVENKTITVTDPTNIGWTIKKRTETGKNITVENNEKYVYPQKSTSIFDSTSRYVNFADKGSGEYQLFTQSGDKYYFLKYGSNWTKGSATKVNGSVYLYALKEVNRDPVTVTLDFGLPVDIPVLSNDELASSAELVGISSASAVPDGGFSSSLDGTAFAEELDLKYGSAEITNGAVRYTPNEKFMNQTAGETFTYAVRCGVGYVYGTVTVVPDAVVYYEENFISWKLDGGEIVQTDLEMEPDLQSADPAYPCGYDPAYADNTGFSQGSAYTATLTGEQCITAEFIFTGTGFEVIGLTGNTTGILVAEVYDSADTLVESLVVDTYYSGETPLYQVPVLKLTDLTFGSYRVVLTAAHVPQMIHAAPGGSAVCLDGVRIYHADLQEDQLQFLSLRKLLLDTQVPLSGEGLYIDGKENATLDEYESFGPKNEVYLAPGQAIVLDPGVSSGEIAALHIGLKCVGGSAVCQIMSATDGSFELNTNTSMFYDITSLAGQTIVITNPGSGGIVSLTELKIVLAPVSAS